MYHNILVPIDGSDLSAKAVEQALGVAKMCGAAMTPLHVIPPVEGLPARDFAEDYEASLEEGYILPATLRQKIQDDFAARAGRMLEAICAKAAASGVRCRPVVLTSDAPHDAILRQAVQSNCDLIVMASHGRKGMQALLLGSETAKVLVHSKVPVLVVR